MAETREEQQRRRRRKRLIRGLLMGGAAVGVPALVNLAVSRRAERLPTAAWGSGDRYSWSGGEIVFQRLGDGPPVVLLHSFGPGHSNLEWRRSAEILAAEHRVVAPDLLGWGASERPDTVYDSELYIRLLGDFLKDVVGERAVIAAAGLSAAYAVQLAADQPELVRALALVTPLGVEEFSDEPDLKDVVVHRMLRLPILGTSTLNAYTSRKAIAAYLERDVYGSAAAVREDVVEEYYRSSHRPGGHAALAAYLSGYLNHGVRGVLRHLDAPVWLGWGRRALNPRIESADLWLRHLSRHDLERAGEGPRPERRSADLEVFEQCGILPHAESPDEFCRKLQLFLTSLKA